MLSDVFVYAIVFADSDHNCCAFAWVSFLSLSHTLFFGVSPILLDVARIGIGV